MKPQRHGGCGSFSSVELRIDIELATPLLGSLSLSLSLSLPLPLSHSLSLSFILLRHPATHSPHRMLKIILLPCPVRLLICFGAELVVGLVSGEAVKALCGLSLLVGRRERARVLSKVSSRDGLVVLFCRLLEVYLRLVWVDVCRLGPFCTCLALELVLGLGPEALG